MPAPGGLDHRRGRPAVPHHRGRAVVLEPPPGTPDMADRGAVRRWVQERRAAGPTAIDLFCGAGGLSLGLRDAGFTVLLGADADRHAIQTHHGNLGGLFYDGDLTQPDELLERLEQWGIAAGTVDLVAGGPPCQPFSRAGRSRIRELVARGERSGDDARAQLWRSFMAVVEHLQPAGVLVENVPDLPAWNDGAVLVGFFENLRALGYTVDARVIDTYRHGVPQHRARLLITGLRDGGSFPWPEPDDEMVSLRDAIGDLPIVPGGHRVETIEYHARRIQSRFARRMRRDMPDGQAGWLHDHITRAVRDDDAEAFALMAEGQTYADIPERLRRYRSDIFTDKYKRLAWDELSRTITAHIAKDGYWYIHPELDRTLSIREAARIQTFPDWFRFAGQPTHRYRQIGNAVPPRLGEVIGEAFISALNGTHQLTGEDALHEVMRDRLLVWHADHHRSFPWRRRGARPWHVLMAEICLHRTRADQVAPVYEALLRIAPTPAAMVEHADNALEVMRSLGLNWRAENIIAIARILVDEHHGHVPDTELGLRMLPGVGDYVAQAVLCFGFGRRTILMDTNTMRIMGRLHGRDLANRRWQLRLDLHRLAGIEGPDAEFNYALLDLGALACRAGAPRCDRCPLREHCATGRGRTDEAAPQLDLAPVAVA
jgi:DNA (cytosine-5)-methyltransferase 1